jgi:tryptophan synthase alpha chain
MNKNNFEKYSLKNIFLITPQTSVERIHFIDVFRWFYLYGEFSRCYRIKTGFGSAQEDYFKRIADMNLKNPQVIGFGINNKRNF